MIELTLLQTDEFALLVQLATAWDIAKRAGTEIEVKVYAADAKFQAHVVPFMHQVALRAFMLGLTAVALTIDLGQRSRLWWNLWSARSVCVEGAAENISVKLLPSAVEVHPDMTRFLRRLGKVTQAELPSSGQVIQARGFEAVVKISAKKGRKTKKA